MVATVVAVSSGQTSSGTSHTLTLSAASNSANTILLYAQSAFQTVSLTLTSPAGFSTDFNAAPISSNIPTSGKYFYRKNPGSSVSTITITTSGTASVEWYAIEVSGLATGAIGSSVNYDDGNYADTHSNPFTTTSANEFVFAVGSYFAGASAPPTTYTGFTLRATIDGSYTSVLTQTDAGAAGTKSLDVTNSGAGRNIWGIVTYQLGATGPTVSTKRFNNSRHHFGTRR